MFTGIIQEIGTVKAVNFSGSTNKLRIECKEIIKDAKLGDSIAVNGVCLTVCGMGDTWFEADVMPETMRRTGFANLKRTAKVNLEPALKLGDRLGGHLVSGHIDGVGKVREIRREQNAVWMTFEVQPEIIRYVILKGSAAIDGTSLTVTEVDAGSFSVSLIPATLTGTILGEKKAGDTVNIECDMVGKYIEKLIMQKDKDSAVQNALSMDFLSDNGFA